MLQIIPKLDLNGLLQVKIHFLVCNWDMVKIHKVSSFMDITLMLKILSDKTHGGKISPNLV